MATNSSRGSGLGPRQGNQMFRLAPTSEYKKNLEEMVSQLETAVNNCCPTMVKPYNRVGVLALHWQNDDMGVEGLEEELLKEFREHWNFTTESYVIPTGPSAAVVEMEFTRRIIDFKYKYNEEDTLMIIVYSGHGMISSDCKEYFISGKLENPNNPQKMALSNTKLDFFEIDRIFRRNLYADTCYIFDSCYAGNIATNAAGEVEIFAASGLWDMAGAKLHTSFTRRLIDILKTKRGGTSFGEIHGQMAAEHRNKQLTATPAFIPRSNTQPQIQLKPVRLTGRYFQLPDTIPHDQRIAKLKSLPPGSSRVLVSVQLQDSVTLPDLEQWTKWLTRDIPSNISTIGIEAIFDSTSQLILLTLPFQLWAMLPIEDASWSFVGVVSSHNRIPEYQAQQVQQQQGSYGPLAVRSSAPSGSENIRPGSSSGQGRGGVGRGGPVDDPSISRGK